MSEKNLFKLIILHICIGFLVAFNLFFSKIYAILIVLIGLWFVVKNKSRNNEVLYIIAYMVGSEVFFKNYLWKPNS